MKLDSEKQRKRILDLLGKVPVHTNLATLVKGGDDELKELFAAIETAELEEPVRLHDEAPEANPVDEPPERDTAEG